ncbi:unnamed protein product [Periconia digitata]|uniref:Uncharacterized protein n=1 Tax=Periconia digitata TaxID=1303443 RepID=A0A9W4U7D6_9PLEO|nr:unnamed protein product [Periconia digitata]
MAPSPIIFPREHVMDLGTGTIGPLTFKHSAKGTLLSASAPLLDAPFNHMIIKSPRLLAMFDFESNKVDVMRVVPKSFSFVLTPTFFLKSRVFLLPEYQSCTSIW